MNIDLTYIIEKGAQFAEHATSEDEVHNYELAAQAYMAASDCFIHVTKYGIMDEEMKQNIYAKVESYVKRAEEIKSIIENEVTKKETLVDDTTACESSKRAIVSDSKVTFDDVIGLAKAKTALLETIILPSKFPKLFQDKSKPSTPVLLYGPIGIGKTYLAKSITAECKTTFISVRSWDFFSRDFGYNEKYVSSLFELARERQPCILFIDDMEGLSKKHHDLHLESFRRITSELLIQMDGIRRDNMNVFLLGAISTPWELDAAIRRRFEKRIYIPLPGLNERTAQFKMHFDTSTNHTINEHEWMQLAEQTENYSGFDIAVICREALFRPFRQLISATHFKRVPNPKSDGPRQLWFACSSEDPNAKMITIDKMEFDELYIPPITMSDMLAALVTIKSTINETDMVKYQEFTEEFGGDNSQRK